MNYYDDVEFLRLYVEDHFMPPKVTDKEPQDIFRTKNAKCCASAIVLKKCYDNLGSDPLDYIEDILNDFTVEAIFCKQEINKKFYSDSAEAVDELKRVLLKRRN